MKQNALLIALSMSALALAGCTTESEPTSSSQGVDGGEVNADEINLGNQGAIEGLVVDDNYRPVQLKQDWGNSQPGDYQDLGFVLVLETGQRYETTENGEFNVFPIEPGTYTLRVAADGHEAKDTKVNVVRGEWTEATLEARRQYSGGGTLLSQEQTLFMSCSVTTAAVKVALAALGGCGDLSGDSGRFDFYTDYASIEDDIRGMVTEMYAHQDGYYSVTQRIVGCCEFGDWFQYGSHSDRGRYGHQVLYPMLAAERHGDEAIEGDAYLTYREEGEPGWCTAYEGTGCTGFVALTFQEPFQTALFADHPSKEYQDTATRAAGQADRWGTGVTLGTKAQFLQNIFLYELPEQGIQDYCQLCGDAAIPE